MLKGMIRRLAIVAALVFAGFAFPMPDAKPALDNAGDAKGPHASAPAPRTFLLAVGKARAADPARQQERAAVAVRIVADAARQFQPAIIVDALAENVMTREQFRRGEVEAKVHGAVFRQRLQQLAQAATAQDTVIIYTHTHGTRGGPDASRPPGGLLLDPAWRRPETRGVLTWDEYAELLLDIPAKNVVVLTMACYSGGLAEHLDSPQVRERWEGRRQWEGRNLVVLTSQNKDLPSPPIMKGGELVNPFTYAVAEAFAGKADGFALASGEPDKHQAKDGNLTVGEFIDFVLFTAPNAVSENARRENNAEPQVLGSFNREDVLLARRGGGAMARPMALPHSASDGRNQNDD